LTDQTLIFETRLIHHDQAASNPTVLAFQSAETAPWFPKTADDRKNKFPRSVWRRKPEDRIKGPKRPRQKGKAHYRQTTGKQSRPAKRISDSLAEFGQVFVQKFKTTTEEWTLHKFERNLPKIDSPPQSQRSINWANLSRDAYGNQSCKHSLWSPWEWATGAPKGSACPV